MSKKAQSTKKNASSTAPKKAVTTSVFQASVSTLYDIRLSPDSSVEIPQLGKIIRPKDLTLEEAHKCFEEGCDWITKK